VSIEPATDAGDRAEGEGGRHREGEAVEVERDRKCRDAWACR